MNLVGSTSVVAAFIGWSMVVPAPEAIAAQAHIRPQWRVRIPRTGWVAFSSHGRALAVAEAERSKLVIRLRELRTGRAHVTLRGFDLGISALAISRDGRLVATATGVNNPRYGEVYFGVLQLWNARTGKLLRTLRPRRKQKFIVYSLAFSPNGHTLASGGGDTLMRLWDVRTGREQRVVPFHGYVNALAFSPDGKRVAAGGNVGDSSPEQFHIWNVTTMKTLFWKRVDNRLRLPENIRSISFSPDGRYLLTALSLWDCRTRRRAFDFSPLIVLPDGNFRLPTFTPSGAVRGIISRRGRLRLLSLDVRTLRPRYGRTIASDMEIDWLGFAPGARSLLVYSLVSGSLQSINFD